MNKVSLLICFLALGNTNLHAMSINEHVIHNSHVVSYNTFRNSDLKAITFTSNKDLTFIGTPLEVCNNLKYIAFITEDQKIVTKNGIKNKNNLDPSKDLGAPANCNIVDANIIDSMITIKNCIKTINPNNLSKISFEENKEQKNKIHAEPKEKKKIVQPKKMTLFELDELANKAISDIEYAHTICLYVEKNKDTLSNYSRYVPEYNIINEKFNELCKIMGYSTPIPLLRSINLESYRLSFSLAPNCHHLLIIDNKLPIEDDNCRIRFISIDNKYLENTDAIKERVLNDKTNYKLRFTMFCN